MRSGLYSRLCLFHLIWQVLKSGRDISRKNQQPTAGGHKIYEDRLTTEKKNQQVYFHPLNWPIMLQNN